MDKYTAVWLRFFAYVLMFFGLYVFFFRVYENKVGRVDTHITIDFTEHHQLVGCIFFTAGVTFYFLYKNRK